MDRDPKGHLDVVFGLAERFGRPVDIHLHERGELGAFSLELIIERTKALTMQGKVTVSHAFCLGVADQDYVAHLIDALAEAGVQIMTTGPAASPAPPIKRLIEPGVRFGSADALRRPDLGRLQPGAKADIVVIDLGHDRIGQMIDPLQTVIVGGSGRDVRMVVIDGRFVMIDGAIPGFDAAAAQARAQAQFDRLVALYPERTYGHPPLHEIFSSSYPREAPAR